MKRVMLAVAYTLLLGMVLVGYGWLMINYGDQIVIGLSAILIVCGIVYAGRRLSEPAKKKEG